GHLIPNVRIGVFKTLDPFFDLLLGLPGDWFNLFPYKLNSLVRMTLEYSDRVKSAEFVLSAQASPKVFLCLRVQLLKRLVPSQFGKRGRVEGGLPIHDPDTRQDHESNSVRGGIQV